MQERFVFFADVLGFGAMSRRPQADPAVDALTDIYSLLSEDDAIAKLLREPIWEHQFALSDSLFLVAADPVGACREAASFFFNLAFYNCDPKTESPVLLRGGISSGTARVIDGIFPETTAKNLVGDAVVEAVKLEQSPAKGPFLFVTSQVADHLAKAESSPGQSWLLDRPKGQAAELLWILPANVSAVNPTLIGDVCACAVRLFKRHAGEPRLRPHYLGYLDLVVRSLVRLQQHDPEACRVAAARTGFGGVSALLQGTGEPSAVLILEQLERLVGRSE